MCRGVVEVESIQDVCGSVAEDIVEIELIQTMCKSLVELSSGRAAKQKNGEHERRKKFV